MSVLNAVQMATSAESVIKKEDRKKPTVPQIRRLESKEEWISEEELCTEGSSDEDDMALRKKRRELRENERKEIEKWKAAEAGTQSFNQGNDRGAGDMNVTTSDIVGEVVCEQEEDDDCYVWRPTQGSFKLKHHSSPEENAVTQNGDLQLTQRKLCEGHKGTSLSEAYSSMHKLDAMLKDSDRKLKEAQAETLRAQLSTRAQLQNLRNQVGKTNIALTRNWDSFMNLCPAQTASPEGNTPRRRHAGAGAEGDLNEYVEESILPGISGYSDSDFDEESGIRLDTELAITDEEKIRLSRLLLEVEGGEDDGDDGAFRADVGYSLDEEARRRLEDIDSKLLEMEAGCTDSEVANTPDGVAAGATRRQRLDDIDRCLEALERAALEDVEPVNDEEMSRLLEHSEDARGVRCTESIREPGVLSDLLAEARRELPRFKFRHGGAGQL